MTSQDIAVAYPRCNRGVSFYPYGFCKCVERSRGWCSRGVAGATTEDITGAHSRCNRGVSFYLDGFCKSLGRSHGWGAIVGSLEGCWYVFTVTYLVGEATPGTGSDEVQLWCVHAIYRLLHYYGGLVYFTCMDGTVPVWRVLRGRCNCGVLRRCNRGVLRCRLCHPGSGEVQSWCTANSSVPYLYMYGTETPRVHAVTL